MHLHMLFHFETIFCRFCLDWLLNTLFPSEKCTKIKTCSNWHFNDLLQKKHKQKTKIREKREDAAFT